ncbi:SubName: Full=Uncharacterized protein {ECO:0000313/EMBL:CCA68006.1} [Serendipita indica DSM 11827]|nr:SubName: Full=Uncharacterized protein {ECO:0000313/EMBL:CCA68006.1} [Serendipita indica DSM 11827]
MAEFPGIAQTFAEVINQTSQAQEDLEELSRSGKADGYTVACLSTETILLRRTLRKLREYCQENQRLLKGHSNTTAKDINLSLLSTSLALSEIEFKVRKITLGAISVRTPRLRLFERAKKEEDELNPLLNKLRDRCSLLWSLYLILDPFAESDEEAHQLRMYVQIMLRQNESDVNRRLNTNSFVRPDYIATLWPNWIPPRPLTKELVRHGLSEDQIHEIYDKPNLPPFLIKQILLKWRSYGTEDAFRIVLHLFVSTGHDLVLTDEVVRTWKSYGDTEGYRTDLGVVAARSRDIVSSDKEIPDFRSSLKPYGQEFYIMLLKALRTVHYNLHLTERLLQRAAVLMHNQIQLRPGDAAFDTLPAVKLSPSDLDHLSVAIGLNDHDLSKVVDQLEMLRDISWPQTGLHGLIGASNCPTGHYLDLWHSCGYDAKKASDKIWSFLMQVAREGDCYWTVPTALIVLRPFNLQEEAFFSTITEPHVAPIRSTLLALIGSNAERHSIPSIISDTITIANYMGLRWRAAGLHKLAYTLRAVTLISTFNY